jgi:hypothetical protein
MGLCGYVFEYPPSHIKRNLEKYNILGAITFELFNVQK